MRTTLAIKAINSKDTRTDNELALYIWYDLKIVHLATTLSPRQFTQNKNFLRRSPRLMHADKDMWLIPMASTDRVWHRGPHRPGEQTVLVQRDRHVLGQGHRELSWSQNENTLQRPGKFVAASGTLY